MPQNDPAIIGYITIKSKLDSCFLPKVHSKLETFFEISDITFLHEN